MPMLLQATLMKLMHITHAHTERYMKAERGKGSVGVRGEHIRGIGVNMIKLHYIYICIYIYRI